MDWWRLFSGTFVLIFLAELGDKTQLAAMARATDGPSGSGARWVVFLAASSALVLSTLIAVFLGDVLKRYVPEVYIKTASGVLFVVFGIVILYGVWQTYRTGASVSATPPKTTAGEADPGYLGQLVVKAAMDFESTSGERYRAYADKTADLHLAGLLRELAKAEDKHLSRLAEMANAEEKPSFSEHTSLAAGEADSDFANTPSSSIGREAVANLLEYENASADFYQSLAERTLIPGLRPVFQSLANEERDHAKRLRELIARSGRFPL